MVNTKIRKAYLNNKLPVAMIGNKLDLTYPYKYLGNNPWILKQITDGDHPLCKDLKKAKNPMLIFGEHLTTQDDFEAYEYFMAKLLNQYNYLGKNWNGYNILHTAASRVGGLDIGFVPNDKNMDTNQILQKCEIIIFLGADEIDLKKLNPKAFIVYIGHHGDKVAEIADVILPAPAFTEKNSTYVNLEGRVQNTYSAIDPLGEAQIDWKIILDLAKLTGVKLPYSKLSEIRNIMSKTNPVFKTTDSLVSNDLIKTPLKQKNFAKDIFDNQPSNYYLSNSICRNSITMRKCAKF